MEWFFMNLENPVASTPLLVPNPKKGAANSGGEPDEIEPELDMNMVQMLQANGAPELAAKHAVHNAGAQGVEAAMEWFFMNIENPITKTPLLVPNPNKKKAAASSGYQADPESLMMMTSMGFDEKQGTRALRKCDGNLERALDWIMSHMDEPDSEDEDAGAEGTMDVD